MTPPTELRGALLVALAALAAYANSVGNGFAYDDTWVLESNPIVTEGLLHRVPHTPYWPGAVAGTGNYRPLTVGTFAVEWRLWNGDARGFHAVNVALHAGVSLLVFALLSALTGPVGGLAGGLFFAVHPVHVEAVANIVGRAELLAAGFVLAAVLLYRRTAGGSPAVRAAGLGGVALLYALGLASKEMAVTLPGLLLIVAVYTGDESLRARIRRTVPHIGLLAAVLGTYLLVRLDVLGAFTGESPAAGLRGLDTGERVLTALTVWPQYLRLLVVPLDLSMDYQPAVLPVARSVGPMVVVGLGVLAALVGGAWALRRDHPEAGLGLAWFVVAVLPVSNLIVRSDVLLAERTLYLPSVGAALVVAAAAAASSARLGGDSVGGRGRRAATVAGVVVLAALMVRTVTRNPAWMDTYTAVAELGRTHPESYLAIRARAAGLERVGELEEAERFFELGLALAPGDYGLMVEIAGFHARHGRMDRAEALLAEAVRIVPDHPFAYRRLAEYRLRAGRGREAHAAAVRGLARAGADAQLFSLLSESYVAKGDLEAALRARSAAADLEPRSRNHWARLARLYEALGRADDARGAQARADALPPEAPPQEIAW